MSQFKPRADAKLKTLPGARQAEIAQLLQTQSIEYTRAQLAKQGIKVSGACLSSFFSWWQLQNSPRGQILDLKVQLDRIEKMLRKRERSRDQAAARATIAALILSDGTLADAKVVASLRRVLRIK